MQLNPISEVAQRQPVQPVQRTAASRGQTTNQQPAPSAQAMRKIQSVSDLKVAESQGTSIPISDEQLIRAIDRAIKAMQGPMTQLDFSVHEATKEIMVKVLDKETGEVIREIPPEKSLDFVAKLWEMAGILVDERR